jgi:glycosyltransferase involved in cell wall biosynthesis
MLAGVPVVATATGGVVDVIRHKETGLLVPESSPALIAAAIGELCSKTDLRTRLIDNARAIAAKGLTRSASAERFSELFQRVIGCR